MHTVLVVAGGFALLAVCLLIGRFFGGGKSVAKASLVFLPLWLLGAGVNMWVGVARAGYSVNEELPVFLIVFAVPAAVGFAIWWKCRVR